MHPSRYLLRAFHERAFLAPPNDDGFDPDDDAGDGDDDGDDRDDDDGEDGFDGDDPDDDDGEEGDDPEPEPRRQSRGENRVAKATREAKEARERAEALEARLADLERQRNAPPARDPAADAAARERHLASLTPDQKVEFLLEENRRTTQHTLQQTQFQVWDMGDKAAFQSLAATHPALKGMEAEVEAELAKLRASGGNAPRENVAKFLLGQKALTRAPKARKQGERRAAEGRERNNARPANGRSDAPADRSRGGNGLSALEKRLEGKLI